ncbi:hypothetical protein [Paramuribaculum intestinale]|nr:hypothetical protein [Paramuribaculum intestinale]
MIKSNDPSSPERLGILTPTISTIYSNTADTSCSLAGTFDTHLRRTIM